jgi:hypothetical protein
MNTETELAEGVKRENSFASEAFHDLPAGG